MQYLRAFTILLVALVVPIHAVSGAETPPSTQNVARLQNFGTLVSFLNLASGTVRLVVILEPSDESSEDALRAVQSVLESNPSKRLRAYVVWCRLGEDDTELRALTLCNLVRDRRLVFFWDAQAFVANAYRGVLDSTSDPATGVLLLYDTDAHLALAPPAPSMWMSVNPNLEGKALDAAQLGAHANAMVRSVEAKVTDGTPPKP